MFYRTSTQCPTTQEVNIPFVEERFPMQKLIMSSAVLACFALLLALPAHAQSQPDALTVDGFVENQVCLSGDFVQVSFSASATSDSQPVGFRWDFESDGIPDTRRNTNPDAVHIFPDETIVTSRVVAVNKAGNRAQDRITFSTLRCTN